MSLSYSGVLLLYNMLFLPSSFFVRRSAYFVPLDFNITLFIRECLEKDYEITNVNLKMGGGGYDGGTSLISV